MEIPSPEKAGEAVSLVYPVKRGAAYFAGLELPFFVSTSQVVAGARERGFSQVIVSDRDKARFAFDVKKVPGYREPWDAAFFGIYEGRSPTIEVPARPVWLFEVQSQIPPPGKTVVAEPVAPLLPGQSPPATKPNGGRLVLFLAGGVAVYIFFATLRPVTPRRR
jgi:hypothetical protein